MWYNARMRIPKCVAIVSAVLVLFAGTAFAHHNMPDTDGKVPVEWECEAGGDNWLGWTEGYYVTDPGGKVVEAVWTVHVDRCKIRRLGGGDRDIRFVERHELGHAHGFAHYEEPERKNPAYEPGYTLTGR